MAKAILKNIWVDSATINLDTYLPDDIECFELWVNLRVGVDSAEGADDYQLLICTPQWLQKNYAWKKALWGRNMLIVFEYDLEMIKSKIDRCLASFGDESVETLSREFAKFASWEFENYQHHPETKAVYSDD
ncbi:MAG: immunity 8 family protein [Janthinobacterium lividum]